MPQCSSLDPACLQLVKDWKSCQKIWRIWGATAWCAGGRVDKPENFEELYDMAEKYDFYIADRPHTWKWAPGRDADTWHTTIERVMQHPRLQS